MDGDKNGMKSTNVDGFQGKDKNGGSKTDERPNRFVEMMAGDYEKEGVFSSRFAEIKPILLSFGRALGGQPEHLDDLPFTEESGTEKMPEPLYVRHDEEMLTQLTSWLLQGQHIGLVSPYGTGKTALREIAARDLGDRDDFVVANVKNPNATTERGLYEGVIKAARDAGYKIDPENYWQVRNGIPWATAETRDAVRETSQKARKDDTTVLLIVDEIEDLPTKLLSPLQTTGDLGVRLFLSGTPEGKERLHEFRETLDSRVRYYEEINPFSPADIAEYIARSFAYFCDESYDGQQPPLFTAEAIKWIHDQTDGNPREVRLECMDLFARAAFVWHRSGHDIGRINITPALRHRNISMAPPD
ncbi:AAA family ATPase [Halovenus rubra]|uniref:AAA family ATPase n=2 Tax=Halovenus rubra TaxID=869890 RepID=A0ABD5XED7_9EURY|nr:AAA family ATPase [Halovenus rubra]